MIRVRVGGFRTGNLNAKTRGKRGKYTLTAQKFDVKIIYTPVFNKSHPISEIGLDHLWQRLIPFY
jgi:hypothetical protein